MDFNLSEEQRLLQDSVRRFIGEQYGFPERRRRLESELGFDRAHWARYAELGWLAISLPAAAGGLEGSTVDNAIVLEELGRGLALEPYLSTAVLGTRLLAASASPSAREVLAAAGTGDAILALAAYEAGARYDTARVATTAKPVAQGHTLNGRKILAIDGHAADWLLVTARVRGAHDDAGGIGLFLVRADAPGVARESYRTIDGLRSSDVTFTEVQLPPDSCVLEPEAAWDRLDEALDHANVGLCAEALGCMQAVLAMSADYIKTRRQFGRALADFQVLQHRCADMFIEIDQARSALFQALGALGASPRERRWAVSACKVRVSQAARFVGGEGIHLHGGNGMTDEYAVGHYFRRLLVIEKTYGDLEHHLDRCIDSSAVLSSWGAGRLERAIGNL